MQHVVFQLGQIPLRAQEKDRSGILGDRVNLGQVDFFYKNVHVIQIFEYFTKVRHVFFLQSGRNVQIRDRFQRHIFDRRAHPELRLIAGGISNRYNIADILCRRFKHVVCCNSFRAFSTFNDIVAFGIGGCARLAYRLVDDIRVAVQRNIGDADM